MSDCITYDLTTCNNDSFFTMLYQLYFFISIYVFLMFLERVVGRLEIMDWGFAIGLMLI